ncbi:hypothetical protein, partial [Ilyobacter sp.]|uniref:hypothetical protein n=1 Tax=Ilyobacter sp. TaxID=3100343 RepID=UPI003567F579
MKEMYFKIFGNPQIKVDNTVISPSLKRGEALLYYMAINRRVSRDEIIDLFWMDSDKKSSRKNLRNLLYKLKQDLGFDLIISINREILVLNPNIRITSDYSDFMDGVGEHNGVILEECCKGIPMFNQWKERLLKKINDKFLETAFLELANSMGKQEFEIAEKLAQRIVKIDSENLRAYFELMKIYNEKGEDKKVCDIYDKLCTLFDGVQDKNLKNEIEDFYKNVFIRRAGEISKSKSNRESFFIRNRELGILEEEYRDFIEKDIKKIVMIQGEGGIGKTHLIDKFLKKINCEESDVIYYSCTKGDFNKKFKLCKELFY